MTTPPVKVPREATAFLFQSNAHRCSLIHALEDREAKLVAQNAEDYVSAVRQDIDRVRSMLALCHAAASPPQELEQVARDERSITEVQPDDLKGFVQCHFFCGSLGWPLALRLAGIADGRPLWSGSCPCQPFASAGQRRGFRDERHLWPEWLRLIRECRPPIILGEQIDTATVWLDRVFADLETENYACGAADLPAAGVGAKHIRQRLWFVAYADEAGWENSPRLSAVKAQADIGSPAGLVHSEPFIDLRRTPEPDQDWIVDGLSGEGLAVGAYGNSIVPQVAAAFIQAALSE